jgi:hypothetical protein
MWSEKLKMKLSLRKIIAIIRSAFSISPKKSKPLHSYVQAVCVNKIFDGLLGGLSQCIIQNVKYGVISPKFIWASCALLYSLAETPPPPPPRIWAHIRGRYWPAKIDDISL